jgi:hypothetical protein
MGDSDNIDLTTLGDGLPGITPSWGNWLSEASSTCLISQAHELGVELNVTGAQSAKFRIYWQNTNQPQAEAAWNDEQELTEYGACGLAIMLILKLTNYTIVQRAKKGTGIDYWLGFKDSTNPFQNSARLEVSGIMRGDSSKIKDRVNDKTRQTKPSDGFLPAFIVVVEFIDIHSNQLRYMS